MTTPTASEVWRLYVTDGVPASGKHSPEKLEVQAWATSLEDEVADGMATAAASAAAAAASAATSAAAASAVAPIPNGLIPGLVPKSATVTISIATPGVVTWNSHGLAALSPVVLSTTGALPTGLAAATTYYICAGASLLTNSFRLATSVANAIAGTAINTSGSQSGTHTAVANGAYPAGYKGEIIRRQLLSGAAVAVTSSVSKEVNYNDLTPGIWKVYGNVVFLAGSGCITTEYHVCTSITSAAIESDESANAIHPTIVTSQSGIIPVAAKIYTLTANTRIYMNCTQTFSGGTLSVYGTMFSERL